MVADVRPRARRARVINVVGSLRPPVGSGRFWLVQAGVLGVAIFHEIGLDLMGVHLPFGIPSPAITALLLIPVIYAALNFGVRGGFGTALWATALMIPDWIFFPGKTAAHAAVEVGNLAILNAVAVIAGQRVEREEHARRRADELLRASEVAEARYRALFDEQHAPVLVTNAAGEVIEANAAAASLFGVGVSGRNVSDLVDTTVTAILAGAVARLPLGQRVFTPKARTFEVNSSERFVQIVLVDVTEEERRAIEQRAYSAHLVTVQEDERRRLAQDLHDDPVQTLTYLIRMLEHLGDDPSLPADLVPLVRRGAGLAAGVVDLLRTVIHGLRPPVLDDFGVVAALRQLVAEVRARHGVSVRLRVTGDQTRLSAESELTVYRVAQEALSNVVRHAQATHGLVHLHFGEEVVLTVTDDGCGMPASGIASPSCGHLGLTLMRERVDLIGGSLDVRPRKPHGTLVQATLWADRQAPHWLPTSS